MAKYYRNVRPVPQTYPMSCWAASLEWWTRYMSPTRLVTMEQWLIDEYRAFTANVSDTDPNYGAMKADYMLTLLNEKHLFKMGTAYKSGYNLTPDYLNEKLAKGPVFISYYEGDPNVDGGHCNVIINCKVTENTGLAMCRTMEPATGTFMKKCLDHYYTGDVILGWAL